MVILVFVQLHVSTMYYDHHGLPMVSCPSCEFNQGYCMNTERRLFSRTFATTIAYTSKKKNTTPSNNPLPLIAPSYGPGFTSYFFTPNGMPTYHI